jgi:hypothetical protein
MLEGLLFSFSAFVIIFLLIKRHKTMNDKILTTDRLTVVILEQTEWRHKIKPKQLNVISSRIWRDKVTELQGQWRVLDPEADIDKDEPWVEEALKRKRSGLPWLIVQKDKLWYSGPVPQTNKEMLEIIQ